MVKSSKPKPKGSAASKMQQAYPGVSHYRDRHGKLRWRYRKDGITYNLGTVFGNPEFVRRYTAAVSGERQTSSGEVTTGVSQAPRGSLSQVIQSWYTSPDFLRLSELTRRNHRLIAEKLREAYGNNAVADMTLATVKALMAKKADTPSAANNLLKTLRPILDHAKELGLIDYNPAREAKKYSIPNPDGYHTWTETEIRKFQDKWPIGTPADLAMHLMLYTGAARADAVQLGWSNLVSNRLQYRRQKMKGRAGVLIDIPVHPALKQRLDRLPKDSGTFLQTVQGRERCANGLGTAMRDWANAAGVPDCSSHGLRKACARRLAEAGATPHEIMSVTGHKTLAEVERYTSKVSRAGLADKALDRIVGTT